MLLLALLIAAGPPLKAPSALEAKALGPYSASISWKPPIDALGVELQARRSKGRWRMIALQPARPSAFVAHALPPGTALELRARSWNGRAPSDWSKPVMVRTESYVEPALATLAPCVPREKLLEAALGHPLAGAECEARKLQSEALKAGALNLLLVDPVDDGPSCHGPGGNVTVAFAELNGCLRPVGQLLEATLPMALPHVAVPPLRSYWHLTSTQGEASTVELRAGKLTVVDSGTIDAVSAMSDLPRTTDLVLLEQLQGASGAAQLRP